MAKGTVILFLFLGILAVLLVGINIGKKIQVSQSSNLQPTAYNLQPSSVLSLSPSSTPIPAITIPTAITPASSKPKVKGTSVYRDKTCGLQLSFPSSFLSQKTENEQSVIFTDPDNPDDLLAIACAKSIPRPPVTADNIEIITLDKAAGMLYHDKNADGTPRDEVIIKNPNNNLEIIIAGYGETFRNALASFKFL